MTNYKKSSLKSWLDERYAVIALEKFMIGLAIGVSIIMFVVIYLNH